MQQQQSARVPQKRVPIARNVSAGQFAKVNLEQRLFDVGFKQGTMPSINRPTKTKSQDKLLSAKLVSLKDRVGKAEKVMVSQQSIALHGRQEPG